MKKNNIDKTAREECVNILVNAFDKLISDMKVLCAMAIACCKLLDKENCDEDESTKGDN